MNGTSRRGIAVVLTGMVVLFTMLALGTCVTPEGGRLPDAGAADGPARGRGSDEDGRLASPGSPPTRAARESAGESPAAAPGEREVEPHDSGETLPRESGGPAGPLVVRDAATGEVVPHFAVRFRDRGRQPVLALTDERGRLDAFRDWLGRGAISALDAPDLPRERWREAPDPIWRSDHYELSLEVGPTWSLVLTGYGPGEEPALEAWLQVPAGLAFPRDDARTTPVRWEGGAPWVRLPAFGAGMRSFVARQPKALVVRSPREERTGWAAVDGVLGRQPLPLAIDLAPSFVLRGRVRDTAGRTLREASVLLWPEGERPRSAATAGVGGGDVAADGRFELFGLRQRRYSAKFMAPDHETLERVVDVMEPGGCEVVLAPETPGEHTLVVVVRGSRGTSTLAASLFAQGPGAGRARDTDLEREAGRHVGAFRGLHPGVYRLFVEPSAGEAIREADPDGGLAVTLPVDGAVVLNAAATETVDLGVTVNGGEPDRPLVFYGSQDGRGFGPVASIARFGQVRLPAATLTYPLWVVMDGYQPVELSAIEDAADAATLDLAPRPGWGVLLRVVDARGPVEGILATLQGDGLGLSDELGTIAVGLTREESSLSIELVRGEDVVGREGLIRRPASAAVLEVRIED